MSPTTRSHPGAYIVGVVAISEDYHWGCNSILKNPHLTGDERRVALGQLRAAYGKRVAEEREIGIAQHHTDLIYNNPLDGS